MVKIKNLESEKGNCNINKIDHLKVNIAEVGKSKLKTNKELGPWNDDAEEINTKNLWKMKKNLCQTVALL